MLIFLIIYLLIVVFLIYILLKDIVLNVKINRMWRECEKLDQKRKFPN